MYINQETSIVFVDLHDFPNNVKTFICTLFFSHDVVELKKICIRVFGK